MEVVDLSISKKKELENRTDMVGDTIRDEILEYSKNFKTSWINLGRHLYAVYQDKLFYAWGYDKFEDYTEKEVGIKKSLCVKLLKAYLFIEQDEPVYLEKDFVQEREAVKVPSYEAVDVLRLAKKNKEITKDDYKKLRVSVFEKGKDAGEVRKELCSIIKERVQVDPDEERDKRNAASIRKVLTALNVFKKDMEVLKLLPDEIVNEVKDLMDKLEGQF